MGIAKKRLEDKAIVKGKYPLPLEEREKRAAEMSKLLLSQAGVREITFPAPTSSISLALKADGVGTKILIAEALEKYDTIGIDAVAMTANDVISVGARPILLVDYLAQNEDNFSIHRKIIKGIEEGCRIGNIAFVGGETATLGDVIAGYGDGYHFDLSTACLGIIGNNGPILGTEIVEGNIVIGLKSSGLHSNGFLWARPLLLKEFNKSAPYTLHSKTPIGKELGDVLLEPTLIYVRPIVKMIEEIKVKGISHITGGAFKIKLPRIAPENISFVLDNIPEPPWIFREIQRVSGASFDRLYEAFNMGVGMCVVVDKNDTDHAIGIAEDYGFEAQKIGYTIRDDKTRVYIPSKNVIFEKVQPLQTE
jgi:phosphoribosylformylglycinamidine cyclo-ligase